ncbi:hypothetical protein [Accumulibacter sp.]|uniref:hypothetical protein n=1 Tax=Accumulibacter sp. TaxID=2053492 RepID=UPI00258B1607|nr:hypothetical protein [Accumulibacter sp.]
MKLSQAIRLALTATELRLDGKPIPEAHADEIQAADELIALTRGADVLAAIASLRRSGLNLTVDLRPTWRDTGEKAPAIQPFRSIR